MTAYVPDWSIRIFPSAIHPELMAYCRICVPARGIRVLNDTKSESSLTANSMVCIIEFLSSPGNPRIYVARVLTPYSLHNLNVSSTSLNVYPLPILLSDFSLAVSTPNRMVWQPAPFINLSNSSLITSTLDQHTHPKSIFSSTFFLQFVPKIPQIPPYPPSPIKSFEDKFLNGGWGDYFHAPL